ncbi:MAG: adenylate/guanylate cyclase domain-containing protein [Myxococcota bacterium]|nr:adenylate/guanylate cyclase domain-containing protein [Myxococcota bacterium]
MATRTLTVVFTDLSNYTASVGRADREGLRDLIAKHEQMVAPSVEARGGRIVKNLGDSYMALFESASDAAVACLELVSAIGNETGLSIRAAMATGDVEAIDGDAFGEAANLASRILSKTPSGEVWVSSTTRMCMNQTELAWENVGRFRLKGIAGEVPVYRLVPPDRTWLPPSLIEAARAGLLVRVQPGVRPGNLPQDRVVLIEGFEPGSAALVEVVESLPVIPPGNLWLLAYSIAPSDRYAWTDAGRGLVIGQLGAVEVALSAAQAPAPALGGTDTIIFDVGNGSVVDLVMSGLALPAVPMSDVVSSYTYDLLPDGRWTNHSERAVLRVEVDGTGVQIQARGVGVSVSGAQLQIGDKQSLDDGAQIDSAVGRHTFHALFDGGYIGALAFDSSARLGVSEGQTIEIGREPTHPGLALPDRRGQENIRWCVGPRAARAREGGFTMDRALAGRRQAAVRVMAGRVEIEGIHRNCPTHVLRGGEFSRIDGAARLEFDDMIVAGTTIVAVRAPRS